MKKFGWLPRGNKMLDLAQWNAEHRAYWMDLRASIMHPELFPNGIRCPSCSGSLYDTNQLVSESPAIMRVKCMNLACNWKGERYV